MNRHKTTASVARAYFTRLKAQRVNLKRIEASIDLATLDLIELCVMVAAGYLRPGDVRAQEIQRITYKVQSVLKEMEK